MMKIRLVLPVLAMMFAFAGLASAQDKGMKPQPPAKQSAPAESTEASGHDAQTGKPETAEKPQGKTDTGKNAKKGPAQTDKQ